MKPKKGRITLGPFLSQPAKYSFVITRHLDRSPTLAHLSLDASPGMGLWTFLEGFLLLINALAILNEDRFLGPRGWSFSDVSGNNQTKSLKGQFIGLIYATQYMRVPLIVLNVITIAVKLVSG